VSELSELVGQRSIVVCCGSGGVGKTTVAAALAVEAARQGRRTCVVTIDPARRLADALGLGSLSNQPGRVDGDWSGELWAMMLDPKSTFDDLVTRYSESEEQKQTILGNRMYRNLSEALSGTHEYMAMEKLYELHEEGRFDLIVVDTPPTRHALDFIDAPRRLTRFLENRIFRLLMTPTRAYLRAVSFATQAFLRSVSKVVGSEAVNDAVEFFRAFEGMEEGFRNRASRVLELLSDPRTAFVLVASPRGDTLEDATFFAERLEATGIQVAALVVNRMHPRFDRAGATPGGRPEPDGARTAPDEDHDVLGVLRSNLDDFRALAEREDHNLATLAERVAPAPVARVPLLAEDVHDMAGLAAIDASLFDTG
jgi:anion-transporting  ArsA/GET3 family ATPase